MNHEEVSGMAGPLAIDRDAVAELCRKYGVKRLAVFGSAVRHDFDPLHSDVDLVVEYLPGVTSVESYFGLKEELEAVFDRPVDLITAKALRNPFLIRIIERDQRELYAA
jgi:predicted nucleotidyltransferase